MDFVFLNLIMCHILKTDWRLWLTLSHVTKLHELNWISLNQNTNTGLIVETNPEPELLFPFPGRWVCVSTHLCRNSGMVYAGSAIASVAWACTWLADLKLDFLLGWEAFVIKKTLWLFSGFSSAQAATEPKSPTIQLSTEAELEWWRILLPLDSCITVCRSFSKNKLWRY